MRSILRAIKYDCPESFSINWSGYSWVEYKQAGYVNITYTPTCTADVYNSVLHKADSMLAVTTDAKTEWSKIKRVDAIIQISNYDHEYLSRLRSNPQNYNPHRHSIYGILIEGLTVCEGVAQLMNYLLNKCGIFCYVVCGTTDTGGEHAWNIVKVENDYYHIDATFDMCLTINKESIRYDYFCIDNASIKKDREFSDKDTEFIQCDSVKHEYFRTQNRYVANENDLIAVFRKNKSSLQNLTIRCADCVSEKAVIDSYRKVLEENGQYRRSFLYSHSPLGVYMFGMTN